MIKVFKLILLLLLSTGCTYEPILIKNNYNYNFVEINSSGNQEINRIIKNKLLLSTKKKTKTNYKIFFQYEKEKKIISSDKKGDPTIYKIIA